MQMLKKLVRYLNPFGPRCLSMIEDRPSGPSALELLAFLMAFKVWAGVKTGAWSLALRFILLRIFCKACLGFFSVLGVYCLLKLVASFFG